MRYTKEEKEMAVHLREIRISGDMRSYAMLPEEEIMDARNWLARRDYENQLMQVVIDAMIKGGSPCPWCEEYKDCKKKQKDNRGCHGWWLRFLTEEEEKACRDRAEGKKDDQ